MTTATRTLIPVTDVKPGDILITGTLTGELARTRITDVERTTVTVTMPITGRRTYPVVRLHGHGSLDYAPEMHVTVLR